MRRSVRRSILLIALAVLAARPAAAQKYPHEPGDGIADLANVLTPADADSIRSTLYRMRGTAGVEVRVLTVRNVAAYRAASPEAFATGVYNHWKLGYEQRQDGVLVMLSVDDRFTRIELGDGVPAAQDAAMRAVVVDVMVPRLRDGDLSAGVRDGVVSIARSFGAVEVPAAPAPAAPVVARPAPQPQPVRAPPADPANPYQIPLNTDVMPFMLLLVAVAGGIGVMALVQRMKPRCAHCHAAVRRLKGADLDACLDAGQRREQALGRVRYTVLQCTGCGIHEIERGTRRLGGGDACPQCSYDTLRTDRETLEWASPVAEGRQRVEKDCAHCGWHEEGEVTLPRTQPAPEMDFATVLRVANLTASLLHDDGDSRRGGGGSKRGDSSRGSKGGHSSGRGSSGRW